MDYKTGADYAFSPEERRHRNYTNRWLAAGAAVCASTFLASVLSDPVSGLIAKVLATGISTNIRRDRDEESDED
jgi:hypothetical protein